MDEGSAEHFLRARERHSREARCGESVHWDLDDAIACTVDRLIHPESDEDGVHHIPVPDDPDIIARVFALMRLAVLSECEGRA